jgi:hypothetical protein
LVLATLALVSVSVPTSVSHAEPAGAAAGSGRGAAAVIAAGDEYSCARLENGTVKCWGLNFYGQLGQGDTSYRGDGPGEMGNNLAPIDLGPGRAGSGSGLAAAGSITEVQVAGRGGVPADAVAAVLNVTIAGAAADGFATVFPCGQPVPTASNVNYRAGVDIANTATVQLGDGGKACIYTFAATHLLADVNGHITA